MYLPPDTNPLEAKERFAAALLRHPNDPFKAGLMVFPKHAQCALYVMQEWVHDDYVRECQEQLLEKFGASHFLPTLEELAHDVYTTAVTSSFADDKIKAFDLYAKLRGFINKPAEPTKVNVQVTSNVLVVERFDPKKVIENQARLLREAAEDVI